MSETKADCHLSAVLSKCAAFARPHLFRWVMCLCPFLVAQQVTAAAASPPQIPAVSIGEAVAFYEAGRLDRARDAFLRILEVHPTEPVVLYHLGRLDPDREAAAQYFLKVLLHDPEHVLADDALLAVSRIQFDLGRHDDAVNACNRLLNAYPDSELKDETRFLLGRALLAGRRPELSRMVLQQLLASQPDSTLVRSARLEIADSYRDQGDLIEAAREYLKFETDFPGTEGLERVLWQAGQCLQQAGRDFEAGYVYQRLIRQYPDTPEANRARVARPVPE